MPEQQPTPAPTRKVAAAALGGAVATIAAWVIGLTAGVDVPAGVESAFATVVAVASGYIIRDNA